MEAGGPLNFDQTPFITIWETTQACDLACLHCRAQAQPDPLPGELTREEGIALIDQVADLGSRVFVLSGGDPLKRPDLLELVRHAKSRGLRVGTIPAATPRLTLEAVRALKEAGLDQMALSLDASQPEAHDTFRRSPGAYGKVMKAAGWAREAGLPLQINTTICAWNFGDLDALIERVQQMGIVFWEVFFLVPVGRGAALGAPTPAQFEEAFSKLAALSRKAPFVVKVTEAPHYRRYLLQQGLEFRDRWTKAGPQGSMGTSVQTVNAGKGHLFISSVGEVFPSGFLPLPAGSIRQTPLAQIYRGHPVFLALRDPTLLRGKCGTCEFQAVCGGSRARAYAATGDYLAEDPACAYIPRASKKASPQALCS